MTNQPVWYCDYARRRMCGNSPWCVANGGPCASTKEKEFARRDSRGRLMLNKEMMGVAASQNREKDEDGTPVT